MTYVKDTGISVLASGDLDLNIGNAGPLVTRVDAGKPIGVLAGIHVGCYELFGSDQIRSLRDLKGKTVAATDLGTGRQTFLASMVAHVGLDPRKDIKWVKAPAPEAMRLFTDGKIDAFMAFPPEPQELRVRGIGHVVVDTTKDRPWSQYFCCLLAGNRDFVHKHPVATKRALRAILKASEICAPEPDRVARRLVDKGYTPDYRHALASMRDIVYGKWRDYDPEDTVRFYALRLHEVAIIKSTPQRVISQGTDWRFLDELKQELKG